MDALIKTDATLYDGDLRVRGSSKSILFAATQEGVDETMNLSAMTLPVALLILAFMVRNLRLVLCTVLNLGACAGAAFLVMYAISYVMTVSTVAPSMMLAVALAMSIDYSLFLLSRFQKEITAGRSVDHAVVVMLGTSGKIVLVSGLTLLLCFTMMLVLPVGLVQSLGVSAAVTVFMAVTVALTLTPVLLLMLPEFFRSRRRWGVTMDGCCIGCRKGRGRRGSGTGHDGYGRSRGPSLTESSIGSGAGKTSLLFGLNPKPHDQDGGDALAKVEEELAASCWGGFGRAMQKGWWAVFIVLLAVGVPIAYVLFETHTREKRRWLVIKGVCACLCVCVNGRWMNNRGT